MFKSIILPFVVSQSTNSFMDDNGDTFNLIKFIGIKFQRAETTIQFLHKCQSNRLLPDFTRLKHYTIERARLSTAQIVHIRNRRLIEAISESKNRKNLKFKTEI